MDRKDEGLFGRIAERLRFFSELGAEFVIREDVAQAAGPAVPGPPASRDGEEKDDLESVRRDVLACRRCALARFRKQAVPGEGNFSAGLMFVGEAPGEEEDLQGRPFVGRAGQLLNRIIQAMRFGREEVFITNILKCRPPGNRNPHQDEVRTCSPYLLRQVSLIRPRVIVALGKPAASFFAGQELAMGLLRGRFLDFNGIPVMPTYHPAFLLRNEDNKAYKKQVWEDMKQVMALLGKR